MYPYHGTGGLTFADTELAVNFKVPGSHSVEVGICPSGAWSGTVELHAPGSGGDSPVLRAWQLALRPDQPFRQVLELGAEIDDPCSQLRLEVRRQSAAEALSLVPECATPVSR